MSSLLVTLNCLTGGVFFFDRSLIWRRNHLDRIGSFFRAHSFVYSFLRRFSEVFAHVVGALQSRSPINSF